MKKRILAVALGVALLGSGPVLAKCAFENKTEVKSLTASFEAWKAVTAAMEECGNVKAELDQEFRTKQPEALKAKPALYHIGGVANATLIPLLSDNLVRPLDDLVEKYGQNLTPNQLIKIDGKTMAVAMMVNTQHLMYREDILKDLGIDVPTSYDEVLAAAKKIKEAGVVEYPLGATFKTGWNLGEDFINMYMGFGGEFFSEGNQASINNEAGVKTLEMMKALTEYMDPEYLVSDSTYVQQQFQQGKIAMANLWSSRAGAMDDEKESKVVGKVAMAAAPVAMEGGKPATTIWWDGITIAANISDEEAGNAFRVAMEGMDEEMVKANNDVAVWLIKGYSPTRIAAGAVATAEAGAPAYPASKAHGMMHSALGNGVAAFLNGDKDAKTTLADIESEYTKAAKEGGLL